MSEQLALEFAELAPRNRDPFACEHALRESWRYTVCGLHGEVYTNCRISVCGERPRCVYEPPDNSPGAMARRREWMREHESRKGI